MDVQPNRSLQFFFVGVLIVQQFSQQLTIVEDNLIELSDLFEAEGILGPTVLIEQMKLLHACRQLQQHLQRYGRLPLFDLNFG